MRLGRGRLTWVGVGGIAVAAAIGVGIAITPAPTAPVAHRAAAAPSRPAISITTTPPPTTTAVAAPPPAVIAPVPALAKAPAPKTTAPATPAPPPVVPGCESGCQIVYRLYLPGEAHLDLLQAGDSSAEKGLMAYWVGNRLIAHRGLSSDTPASDDWPIEGTCQGDQCVVSYHTGAHSGEAMLLNVNPSTGITELDSVMSATESIVLSDLNGDGATDVSTLDSTGEPDYADAPVYWTTELNEDGHFVRTGCGTPTQDRNVPAPTAPLTGPCPAF